MNLKQLLFLKASAPKGAWSEAAYTHQNASKLRFIGNNYSFGNAQYADRENFIKGYDRTLTVGAGEVSVSAHDNGVAVLNGTRTGSGTDANLWEMNVDMPAGLYVFKVTPYDPNGKLTNGKNIHLDIWYDGNETATQDKRVTLDGVKDVAKSGTLNAENHVHKVRAWIGVNTNEYDGYMMFYSLMPSDAIITDTGETVPADGHLDINLSSEKAFVYTMQHKSQSK